MIFIMFFRKKGDRLFESGPKTPPRPRVHSFLKVQYITSAICAFYFFLFNSPFFLN